MLRGSSAEFSLEARIFHAICVISIVLVLLVVPVNFMIGLAGPSILMTLVCLILSAIYYLSRVKKRNAVAIILFSILGNILLILNFYFNSGVNGPTLLIFLLSMFLGIATLPKKQYLSWFILNIVTVSSLFILSYKNPGLFIYSYHSDLSRYIDILSSYIIIAFMMFLITDYIRNSYNTEKVSAEQRALELKDSNETKNKLLSILAHDLRSPLSSIQNYLEILSEVKMNENEKLTIQASLLAETINTQQMLSNLLSWSKTQMEGLTVRALRVKLQDILEQALRAQRSAAIEKGILLHSRISDSLYIMADSDMLQLVIRNLVNNAIKFTPEGGKIDITASLAEERCTIMISDNGRGIPYENQEDLFSLKARSTFGTQNEKGVGLGLALCKEFTEAQNGKIWFESVPGKGTTFFISLPACSGSPESTGVLEKRAY